MTKDTKELLVIAGCFLLVLIPAAILKPVLWPVGICLLGWQVGSIFEAFSEADKAYGRRSPPEA